MGAPRRNRKKFSKPRDRYNIPRIEADRSVIKEYGLKNMHELWSAQTELSRLRGNVRMLLAGTSDESTRAHIVSRLSKLGIVSSDVELEKLLDLKANNLLERRLQSRVFRRGLARSMKQARQLIAHGFISIDGVKVNRPGYMVRLTEDDRIGYYKPIDIKPIEAQQVGESADSEGSAEASDNADNAENAVNAETATDSENDNGVEGA